MFEDSGLRVWYKVSDLLEIKEFIDPGLLVVPPPPTVFAMVLNVS